LEHRPRHKPVPACVRMLVIILRHILCMGPPEAAVSVDDLISVPTDDLRKVEKTARRNTVHPIDGEDGFTERVKISGENLPPRDADFEVHLKKVPKTTSTSPEKKEDMYKVLGSDAPRTRPTQVSWVYVSLVIDRLVFILFIALKTCLNVIFIGMLFSSSMQGLA